MKVYVDWDGVCVPRGERWAGLRHDNVWLPGAVDALMGLDADIYSCRLRDHGSPDIREYDYIRNMLNVAGLQHIGIYVDKGKPQGLIVDDNALHFRSWDETLPAILHRVAP